MKKVRWGVLGAANIAYTEVVPAIRKSTQGEVTAIATRNKEKAKRFHVPIVYESYDELINDEAIDAVYIPLPNALHKKWIIKAMNQKKHVLVEKPAVLTAIDMEEIVKIASENNVVFMEAFMYQFHSQHVYVKDLLKSGEIGDFIHIKAHFSFLIDDDQNIRLNKELGGGALWDLGCYGVHAVTQIAGMKPVSVATIGKVSEKHHVDMTSVCFFTDQEKRTAEVSASFEGSFTDRYEIFGEKGTISVEFAFRPDVSKNGKGVVKVLNKDGHIVHEKTFHDDQYLQQMEHVQSCILKGEEPIYNAKKSQQVITCIESAYQSLQDSSKLVTLDLKN